MGYTKGVDKPVEVAQYIRNYSLNRIELVEHSGGNEVHIPCCVFLVKTWFIVAGRVHFNVIDFRAMVLEVQFLNNAIYC
ncbi:hypothetical protein ACRQGZ_05610 [Actinotignum sp. GS-2025c]|uniref:hypothetical protein n=1 Tax=unclassified Actinotignum TaxID=2632702 RepID=UPI003F4665AA